MKQDLWPKDGFKESTRIGSVLEVIATNHLGCYGVEIKIDSLHGHGSQSWVGICREMNKYVTEVSEVDGEVHEGAETCSGTWNLWQLTRLKRNIKHHRDESHQSNWSATFDIFSCRE